MLGVAASGVVGGEYSFKAGLHGPAGGDENELVGFHRVLDEVGVGVQSDEDERGGGK